jgi:CRP/FNR family transcriptional regulator, cyclic AMP receptor protein
MIFGKGPSVAELTKTPFDVATFLEKAGLGRRIIQLKPKQAFFSQGNAADSIFYLQKGRAKITVVSKSGKEATIALLSRATSWEGSRSQPWVGGA